MLWYDLLWYIRYVFFICIIRYSKLLYIITLCSLMWDMPQMFDGFNYFINGIYYYDMMSSTNMDTIDQTNNNLQSKISFPKISIALVPTFITMYIVSWILPTYTVHSVHCPLVQNSQKCNEIRWTQNFILAFLESVSDPEIKHLLYRSLFTYQEHFYFSIRCPCTMHNIQRRLEFCDWT